MFLGPFTLISCYVSNHLDFVLIHPFSCSFKSFCMYIIAEVFNLSVWAYCTLNFSTFLVFIWWNFWFNGKKWMNFGCFDALFANVRQSCSLLSSSVWKSNNCNAFLYVLNLSPKMILKAVFCTLSRSSLFSS